MRPALGQPAPKPVAAAHGTQKNTDQALPHTNTELPKKGASTRLPAISNAISTAPETKISPVTDRRCAGGCTVVFLDRRVRGWLGIGLLRLSTLVLPSNQ